MSTDGPAGVDDDDSDGGHFDGDVGNELFGEFFYLLSYMLVDFAVFRVKHQS